MRRIILIALALTQPGCGYVVRRAGHAVERFRAICWHGSEPDVDPVTGRRFMRCLDSDGSSVWRIPRTHGPDPVDPTP